MAKLAIAIYWSLNLDHKLFTLEYRYVHAYRKGWLEPRMLSKIYIRFWFPGQLINWSTIKSFKLSESRNKKQQNGNFCWLPLFLSFHLISFHYVFRSLPSKNCHVCFVTLKFIVLLRRQKTTIRFPRQLWILAFYVPFVWGSFL